MRSAACLILILAAAVALRVPILRDAVTWFNSDEAVNALVLKHMIQRGELALHAWDASYYGLVEGLLSLPFVGVLGFTPLAAKLGALTGFLLLLVATYVLGTRIHGRAVGLVAAALLAAFSPMLVLWSTLASSGYTLIVAWGSLSLAALEGLRRAPGPVPPWKIALFGAMVGFGLYIYELYLVYAALLGLWAARAASWPRARRQLAAAALFVAGLAIGWAPKLAALTAGTIGSKKPAYALVSLGQMAHNLKLLLGSCGPALFGVNPLHLSEMERWVGHPSSLWRGLGLLFIAAFAGAYLHALVRHAPRLLDKELDSESLLLIVVPLTATLFVISPNAQDMLSNRYLLPWLSALPIFAARALVQLARRSAPAALLAGVFLVAFPVVNIVTAPRRSGEPLLDVIAHLERSGVRGAYGSYWTSYKTTFLSHEELVVTPYLEWDRRPEYTELVGRLPTAAFIFHEQQDEAIHAHFLDELSLSHRRFEVAHIGPYLVYTSPAGKRLL